jgi:hypothetical protein
MRKEGVVVYLEGTFPAYTISGRLRNITLNSVTTIFKPSTS